MDLGLGKEDLVFLMELEKEDALRQSILENSIKFMDLLIQHEKEVNPTPGWGTSRPYTNPSTPYQPTPTYTNNPYQPNTNSHQSQTNPVLTSYLAQPTKNQPHGIPCYQPHTNPLHDHTNFYQSQMNQFQHCTNSAPTCYQSKTNSIPPPNQARTKSKPGPRPGPAARQ